MIPSDLKNYCAPRPLHQGWIVALLLLVYVIVGTLDAQAMDYIHVPPEAMLLKLTSELALEFVQYRAFIVTVTCIAWMAVGAMVKATPELIYEAAWERAARRRETIWRIVFFCPALVTGLVGALLLVRGPI